MSAPFLKTFGHYIEQPRVVASAWKASKYVALASGAALLGWDVLNDYYNPLDDCIQSLPFGN